MLGIACNKVQQNSWLVSSGRIQKGPFEQDVHAPLVHLSYCASLRSTANGRKVL